MIYRNRLKNFKSQNEQSVYVFISMPNSNKSCQTKFDYQLNLLLLRVINLTLVEQHLMGFQDVRIPAIPRWLFSRHFPKNCGRGESLSTVTCPKTVVGDKQGLAPVKYLCTNKASFCVSRILQRSNGLYKDEVSLATLSFGDINRLKTVVSVPCISGDCFKIIGFLQSFNQYPEYKIQLSAKNKKLYFILT